ncbi:hypothetical protein K2173_015195 [Erythroxylum novogranatense]|uniref:Small auxin up regulated protein n=1 Tax=Erythroxylum novogranatense TaxID=1862640 RepID=A0AAV8T1U1_9ROSI|nr:hypothetical protein K2173_015195 [Erythroxylum novogranatense]
MTKGVEVEGRKRAPKGHFVVYVGCQMKRFVIPTSYLKNPTFQQLLDKAAEEYGYDNHNGIVLPCDENTFRRLVIFLANHY